MIRIISKDGTANTVRIIDKNGMDLTKKLAVERVSVEMAAGQGIKGTADLHMHGLDVACPEMAWRITNPSTQSFDPLASMTFRDGTVVTFAKGTGTVSWHKGGGHQMVGERGPEVSCAGSNEIRIDPIAFNRAVREAAAKTEYVLRASKSDCVWLTQDAGITNDLAKAARFTREGAELECKVWVGISIEKLTVAEARVEAASTAVISHKNTGAFLTDKNDNSLWGHDLAQAKRFSWDMAAFIAVGKEWNVETVEAAHARLKAAEEKKLQAAKNAEIVVIYDTSAMAWWGRGYSVLRTRKLADARRYSRIDAEMALRGLVSFADAKPAHVIQDMTAANVFAAELVRHAITPFAGYFKGKFFVDDEKIPSDPSPAAPIVSVAKPDVRTAAPEPVADYVVFSRYYEGWYDRTDTEAGNSDHFGKDPRTARRMTEEVAKEFIRTAREYASHLIVERYTDAIARVEAREGKVAAEAKDCIVRLFGQWLQQNLPGVTCRMWSSNRNSAKRMTRAEALELGQQYKDPITIEQVDPAPSNTNDAPAAKAANDDSYPAGGYVDQHGKPVTLEDLKASWGSPLRAKEAGQ